VWQELVVYGQMAHQLVHVLIIWEQKRVFKTLLIINVMLLEHVHHMSFLAAQQQELGVEQ
jgi:hypothetical protein